MVTEDAGRHFITHEETVMIALGFPDYREKLQESRGRRRNGPKETVAGEITSR